MIGNDGFGEFAEVELEDGRDVVCREAPVDVVVAEHEGVPGLLDHRMIS